MAWIDEPAGNPCGLLGKQKREHQERRIVKLKRRGDGPAWREITVVFRQIEGIRHGATRQTTQIRPA